MTNCESAASDGPTGEKDKEVVDDLMDEVASGTFGYRGHNVLYHKNMFHDPHASHASKNRQLCVLCARWKVRADKHIYEHHAQKKCKMGQLFAQIKKFEELMSINRNTYIHKTEFLAAHKSEERGDLIKLLEKKGHIFVPIDRPDNGNPWEFLLHTEDKEYFRWKEYDNEVTVGYDPIQAPLVNPIRSDINLEGLGEIDRDDEWGWIQLPPKGHNSLVVSRTLDPSKHPLMETLLKTSLESITKGTNPKLVSETWIKNQENIMRTGVNNIGKCLLVGNRKVTVPKMKFDTIIDIELNIFGAGLVAHVDKRILTDKTNGKSFMQTMASVFSAYLNCSEVEEDIKEKVKVKELLEAIYKKQKSRSKVDDIQVVFSSGSFFGVPITPTTPSRKRSMPKADNVQVVFSSGSLCDVSNTATTPSRKLSTPKRATAVSAPSTDGKTKKCPICDSMCTLQAMVVVSMKEAGKMDKYFSSSLVHFLKYTQAVRVCFGHAVEFSNTSM